MTGEIPSELRNLASLFRLDLGGNELFGCVPKALRDAETVGGVEFCEYDEPASNDTATATKTETGQAGTARKITHSPELVASCSKGDAVPDPGDNPGLVNDCAALLAARDTLAGIGLLNWIRIHPYMIGMASTLMTHVPV